MKHNFVKGLALLVPWVIFCACQVDHQESFLSRKKRYVVFPEGSSFSIALCMTVHTLTSDNIFTEGMNWGISYDLPNETKPELKPFLQFKSDRIKTNKYGYKIIPNSKNNVFEYGSWNNDRNHHFVPDKTKYHKSDYYYIQRRHRRELYNKLEVIMNAMGLDGRTCILRALCEASRRLMPKGNTLIEEMMRIAFSLPLKRVFSFEPREHHTYTSAHKAGREGRNCIAMFPGCSFSLIDMALGNYNSPEYHPDYPGIPEEVSETSDTNASPKNVRYNMK